MPESKFTINKRQLQTICGIAVVVLVLALLVFSYPWLQLHLANGLIQSGNYAQAEQILARLVDNKPEWTEPRYKLALSQLYLDKGSEAASTVISLADTSHLDDLELAIIFMDVAEHLINTGHGEAALELAQRVLAERPSNDMLNQAVVEISFMIAEYYDLPLSLDALDTALTVSADNWLLNRKAFNLLLAKALNSPPNLAEPALDAAIKLYPNNIIAITRKASILGSRSGAKAALDYLVQREHSLMNNINEEYLATKRSLISRLSGLEPDADLTQYTAGMPQSMVVDLAIQGLNQARRQGISGYQYYQLAVSEPEVAYEYGRNLMQIEDWDKARTVFGDLQETQPDYANYKAIFATLDAKTETVVEVLKFSGFSSDIAYLSPDGSRLAARLWMTHPPVEEFMFSDLVIVDLSDGSRKSLGDAMIFQWSPDGRFLAYLATTPTGLGRLHIYSIRDDSTYTLPGDYNIIDFNWAADNLMVQAERNDDFRLIHLVPSPSTWRVEQELDWDINSAVNQDYAWISIKKNSLLVHRRQQLPKEYSFDREIVSFSNWSPNGRLAIITDGAGQSWIYDSLNDDLTKIETPGEFAAWGQDQKIFWYLPVWEKLYVMVRLDSSGAIAEYLPYSFNFPLYDLSVAGNGSAIVTVENENIYLRRK